MKTREVTHAEFVSDKKLLSPLFTGRYAKSYLSTVSDKDFRAHGAELANGRRRLAVTEGERTRETADAELVAVSEMFSPLFAGGYAERCDSTVAVRKAVTSDRSPVVRVGEWRVTSEHSRWIGGSESLDGARRHCRNATAMRRDLSAGAAQRGFRQKGSARQASTSP